MTYGQSSPGVENAYSSSDISIFWQGTDVGLVEELSFFAYKLCGAVLIYVRNSLKAGDTANSIRETLKKEYDINIDQFLQLCYVTNDVATHPYIAEVWPRIYEYNTDLLAFSSPETTLFYGRLAGLHDVNDFPFQDDAAVQFYRNVYHKKVNEVYSATPLETYEIAKSYSTDRHGRTRQESIRGSYKYLSYQKHRKMHTRRRSRRSRRKPRIQSHRKSNGKSNRKSPRRVQRRR